MINSGLFSNMVNGGDRGHGLISYQSRGAHSEVENSFVEMEERGYTNLQRKMNDEFILKSMADSSNKVPMPNMEMTGFINHLQIFRTDSEELFKSWITSEESRSLNSTSVVQRTPQGVGRMARELNYVTTVDDGNSTNLNQDSFSLRNVVERGVQASDLHLDKAWFHSTQPMTRSRSSDLRKNYATLQNFQTSVNMETMHDVSGFNTNNAESEMENNNGFYEAPFGNILNHLGTKFIEKQDSEDGSLGVCGVQEVLGDMSLDYNGKRTYLDLSANHVTNPHNRVLQAVEEGQNMATTCESSIQVVNGRDKENGTRARATDYMTITDDQKPKERLVRCGSVSSADPMDEGDATKKRRVERSRKMAEAKERILTPTVPSDMRSIVKRCENLEKEVRSLKLNLAFMNRKDSEQTKQLEELQMLHGELTEEKERLLEEIERILATRRKM